MIKIRRGLAWQLTDVVQQSIDILEQSEDPTDRYLVERARLVQIGHETTTALVSGYLSPTGLNGVSRHEILESFQTRLRVWVRDCPLDVMDGKRNRSRSSECELDTNVWQRI
jgi:hypothetical protein